MKTWPVLSIEHLCWLFLFLLFFVDKKGLKVKNIFHILVILDTDYIFIELETDYSFVDHFPQLLNNRLMNI